jgi:GNAT superfamily N-acetyltransferase
MMLVHELEPGDADPGTAIRGIQPVPKADVTAHQPDRRLTVTDAGALVARCSLWWTRTPRTLTESMGVIGHYAATNHEAGTALLDRACAVLARAGCTTAVGPMDGNTWRRYRFITERGEAPPFFLEPDNPDDWPSHWTGSGFTPLASYTSSANDDLSVVDDRTEAARWRLTESGIAIRRFEPSRADEELRRIYTLSLAAFADNFLYTPLDEQEFMAANLALLPYVRPELMLLAEQADELVGFMFAVPDMLQARRGESIDTVILKTMAVAPSCRGAGLGGVLMDDVQRAARALGFRRAIHALMHERNRSRVLSDRYGHTIRRYTLYARALTHP